MFRKIVFMFSIVLFCVSLNELSDFLKADEQDQSYIQEIVNYEPDFSDDVDLSKNNGSDDIDVSDLRLQRRTEKFRIGLRSF